MRFCISTDDNEACDEVLYDYVLFVPRDLEEALIGEIPVDIALSPSKLSLGIACASGKIVVYEATGDCCSHSWFESIYGETQVLGSPVTGIRAVNIDLLSVYGMKHNNECEENDSGIISYYAYEIATNQGKCLIDFRNSSNGYYGGQMEPSYCLMPRRAVV